MYLMTSSSGVSARKGMGIGCWSLIQARAAAAVTTFGGAFFRGCSSWTPPPAWAHEVSGAASAARATQASGTRRRIAACIGRAPS